MVVLFRGQQQQQAWQQKYDGTFTQVREAFGPVAPDTQTRTARILQYVGQHARRTPARAALCLACGFRRRACRPCGRTRSLECQVRVDRSTPGIAAAYIWVHPTVSHRRQLQNSPPPPLAAAAVYQLPSGYRDLITFADSKTDAISKAGKMCAWRRQHANVHAVSRLFTGLFLGPMNYKPLPKRLVFGKLR